MQAEYAVDRFLSGCYQFADFVEQGGDNHGQVVEAFLKSVGLEPGQPWCMALMSYVGYRSFMCVDYSSLKRTSVWPLPMVGGCQYMGEWAQKKGILYEAPDIGDIFLKYYENHKRWAHTGVLLGQGQDGRWATCEGNTTDEPGSRNGYGVLFKRQKFGPKDRFVRWADLLKDA